MTAEFVVVLPAVLAVLALAVGAIMLASERAVLSATAAEISRLEARGDGEAAAAQLGRLKPGVSVKRETSGALHCVTMTARPVGGLLAVIETRVRGCAAVHEGQK